MMQNCFALSIGIGFTSALDTLVSQSYGAGQNSLSWMYVQRGRVLTTLQLIWMIPVLMFSYEWLSLLREPQDVSADASKYNRAALIGLLGFFQYEANVVYLRNTGYPAVPTKIICVTTLAHVGWAYLFIGRWHLGNQGAGYANAMTWWSMCLLSFAFLLLRAPLLGIARSSILKISRSAFQGWGDYMRLAIPATLQLCSDWWLWEVIAIVVGWFGAEVQAAHNSACNFQAVAFMPAIGVSISAATLVGVSLGENDPKKAKQIVWLCLAISQICWLFIGGIVFLARDALVDLYFPSVEEEDSRRIARGIVCFFVVLGFPSSAQQAAAGAMRGMGKQKNCSWVYLTANWLVSLPLMLFLAFPMNMGIWGVWSGMIFGPTIAAVSFVAILRSCNFEELASSASQKMREAGEKQGCDTTSTGVSSPATPSIDVENAPDRTATRSSASPSPTLLETPLQRENKAIPFLQDANQLSRA
jgi:MATE family multidrug resistance protein